MGLHTFLRQYQVVSNRGSIILIEYIPLQQGLRPLKRLKKSLRSASHWVYSITTRINTATITKSEKSPNKLLFNPFCSITTTALQLSCRAVVVKYFLSYRSIYALYSFPLDRITDHIPSVINGMLSICPISIGKPASKSTCTSFVYSMKKRKVKISARHKPK